MNQLTVECSWLNYAQAYIKRDGNASVPSEIQVDLNGNNNYTLILV